MPTISQLRCCIAMLPGLCVRIVVVPSEAKTNHLSQYDLGGRIGRDRVCVKLARAGCKPSSKQNRALETIVINLVMNEFQVDHEAHVKRRLAYGIFSCGLSLAQQTIIFKAVTPIGPDEMRFWPFSCGVYFVIHFHPARKLLPAYLRLSRRYASSPASGPFLSVSGKQTRVAPSESFTASASSLS
jgi:hypothetical protein